ncbi:UDP-N-acetylmuramate dehydrogenase [Flaviflexus equikiangi]|uniref:UDP-N-acetylenolpyruvoylglucosamine reductase n=1 Tax=Flaviflexus equikiangi TaxID=2758573 RepID=A0ABS2TGS1_9ACTO|nr:UDP-N-acetylmuramate dehydrogenase [Flaviflexus equikiangi]MBM9433827.1 UDP-N-acetylmuramate dehydrogenase [Flaviflexus equikiangi]
MSCTIIEPNDNVDPGPTVPSTRRTGDETFAGLTTIATGGPVGELVRAYSEDDIVEAVREADEEGRAVLMLGGGSNLLASDQGFDGRVVIDMRSEIDQVQVSSCGGAILRGTAGTPWDEFVAVAIANGWHGIEALSGIPGSLGATPVQNVGAYGQEIADTLYSVRVYDREAKKRTDLAPSEIGLSYRNSRLKESTAQWGATGRWIVLSVTYQLGLGTLSTPIAYSQLAQALGVDVGERVPSTDLRAAVLELRRSKGMVLDDSDRDTYSLGSFFTNPIVPAQSIPDGAPSFPHGDLVKTSAAWLIDHAGCGKGYGAEATGGRASLSTKHTLAITNRGGASTEDILTVARSVRERVADTYGITLVNEPVLLGTGLGDAPTR